MEEIEMSQRPKPITFYINRRNDEQLLREEVKFIIEGGGKEIQSSFVRKNEQEYFEFVHDFNNPQSKVNQKRLSIASDSKFLSTVCRKRKTRHSKEFSVNSIIMPPKDFNMEKELEEVCEEAENKNSFTNSDDDSDNETLKPNFNFRKTLKVPQNIIK